MRFIVVQFEFHDRSVSKHLPVSGIEMFHAAHGQNETRAPIRAMTVMDILMESAPLWRPTCAPR